MKNFFKNLGIKPPSTILDEESESSDEIELKKIKKKMNFDS